MRQAALRHGQYRLQLEQSSVIMNTLDALLENLSKEKSVQEFAYKVDGYMYTAKIGSMTII